MKNETKHTDIYDADEKHIGIIIEDTPHTIRAIRMPNGIGTEDSIWSKGQEQEAAEWVEA